MSKFHIRCGVGQGGRIEGGALKKSERRMALVQYVVQNPFVTDEQLSARYHVSVATIRLDRMALQIPELRQRISRVAQAKLDQIRSLEQQEVVGEILEMHLDRYGISVLHITQEHVFARSNIARGHHLFAQANSLAAAVIDADAVLTAKVQLRFHRVVRLGDLLRCRVDIVSKKFGVVKCRVLTSVADQTVVDGVIWMVSSTQGSTQLEDEG